MVKKRCMSGLLGKLLQVICIYLKSYVANRKLITLPLTASLFCLSGPSASATDLPGNTKVAARDVSIPKSHT